jgi:hypothetical protein
MRRRLLGYAAIAAFAIPDLAGAQATTRQCSAVEEAGSACLLARKELPSLPAGQIFWHLDRFPSKDAAEQASIPTSAVVESFGSTWLFTLASSGWRASGGEHVSKIGPLPVAQGSTFAAEYLRSIFNPGATAPLHLHSGPEAFYAVTGDTCLETPEGVQMGRGAGNSLMINGGSPMLLMAIGKNPRRGFALILHDAHRAPTTLTRAWLPKGLCARQLLTDQGSKLTGN